MQIDNIPLMPNPISLTEKSAEMATKAMIEEGFDIDTYGIRIGIMGGGCSGLIHSLDFHDLSNDTGYDWVFDSCGVKVVVDEFSAMHLIGTTIDYMDTLQGSGFKFLNDNPNRRTCGCGSSTGYY